MRWRYADFRTSSGRDRRRSCGARGSRPSASARAPASDLRTRHLGWRDGGPVGACPLVFALGIQRRRRGARVARRERLDRASTRLHADWRGRDYLAPLAAHPAIAPNLRLDAEVLAVTRKGHSKLSGEGRDAAPFVVLWRDAAGERRRALARAVIDASGTWVKPNPIGLDGLPVEGRSRTATASTTAFPTYSAQRARTMPAGIRS